MTAETVGEIRGLCRDKGVGEIRGSGVVFFAVEATVAILSP